MTLSPRQRLVAAAVALLLAVVAAWLFAVSPQRAQAARLETELRTAHERLAATQLEEASTRDKYRRLPSLPILKRAIPDYVAMSGIIRDLNRLASASGLEFDSITPLPLVIVPGYEVLPLNVELHGGYVRLSSFLERLRRQVEVRKGRLRVDGRLYAIESLQLAEGESKFPSLRMTLTLDAFVHVQSATPVAADPSTLPIAAGETP